MSRHAIAILRPAWPERRHTICLREAGHHVRAEDAPAHLLLAREVDRLLPPHHLPPGEDWFLHVLRARGAHRCCLPPYAGLGCALNVVIFDAGSHGLHALITVRDAVGALSDGNWRAAERLEALIATCGVLSHRANNILTCMRSQAEWLTEMPDLPAEAVNASHGILAGLAKWKRVTERLGRLGAALRPRAGRCDPALQLADLAQRLRPGLPREVELAVQAPAGQGWLLMEGAGLEHAIEELVANAVEAVGSHGHIGLAVSPAIARGWPGFAWIAVSVTDDGCGITDQAMEAAGSGLLEENGSGKRLSLGLLIARAFAHGLGGHLVAERIGSGGTRVTLHLPAFRAR